MIIPRGSFLMPLCLGGGDFSLCLPQEFQVGCVPFELVPIARHLCRGLNQVRTMQNPTA